MKNETKNKDGPRKLLRTIRSRTCMRRVIHRTSGPSLTISVPHPVHPEDPLNIRKALQVTAAATRHGAYFQLTHSNQPRTK